MRLKFSFTPIVLVVIIKNEERILGRGIHQELYKGKGTHLQNKVALWGIPFEGMSLNIEGETNEKNNDIGWQ